MPSRKSKGGKSSSASSGNTGPPPNHPLEHSDQTHRHFLVRSIERNDIDLAALVKLNDSLHKAKQNVLESCGELVLLDIGSGLLRLEGEELIEDVNNTTTTNTADDNNTNTDKPSSSKPDDGDDDNGVSEKDKDEKREESGLDGKHHTLSPAQKEICVDFLLRMKLRRKLCSRLVRRLLRLSSAMDGKDVQPPLPPRYGDLPLKIDSKSVEERVKEWNEKAEAKLRIETNLNSNKKINSTNDSGEDEDKAENVAEKGKTTEEISDTMEIDEAEDNKEQKEGQNEDDEQNDQKPDVKQEDPAIGGEGDQSKNDGETPAVDPSSQTTPTLKEDYDLLKEFDTAYEKAWDPTAKVFKYVLAEESDTKDSDETPDYAQIKNGAGIGATARLYTVEEREVEHKRWQNNILNCHPQQPTFEELGLKNRVFFLEERRKRALEEVTDGDEDKADNGVLSPGGKSPSKKQKISPVKRTGGKELRKKVAFEGDDNDDDEGKGTIDAPESTAKKPENSSPQKEQQTKSSEEPEPKRPISLKPIPSFFAQDMGRIKNVQRDLIENSITTHAMTRINEATNEYNRAWKTSLDLVKKLTQIQQDGGATVAAQRQELAQLLALQNKEGQHKAQWLREKRAYDIRRCSVVLPSMQGRRQQGTAKTAAYSRGGPLHAHVAVCLADIIDGCITLSEGKMLVTPFREYVPLPPNDEDKELPNKVQAKKESLMRLESEVKQQYSQANQQYQQSEQTRNRAWRKMLQTKSIIGATQELFDIRRNGYYRVTRVTAANHMHFPLPSLHQSRREPLPEEGPSINRAAPAFQAFAPYTPPVPRPAPTPTPTPSPAPAPRNVSTSKYSAARVRERIAADGTVAPVSELKRGKDGLYLRPSGRKRKGMEWDGRNGRWVPENR